MAITRRLKRNIFIAFSVILHLCILFYSDRVLVEKASFDVASKVVDISLDIIPEAPVAEAMSMPVPEPQISEVKKIVEKLKPVEPKKLVAPPKAVAQPQKSQSSTSTTQVKDGTGFVSASPDYLSNPPPVYPRESRLAGDEGVVLLKVTLDEDGKVKSLDLKKSSGFQELDASALEAVKGWKFKPAKLGGVAIGSVVEVPVRFELE